MIVGNFFNIKNTNGLLYYGIDYLREEPALVRKVLVRPALLDAVRKLLPGIAVQGCGPASWLREAGAAAVRGDLLYTPTPHPLPFISHQWVVAHDRYPFTTQRGALKRFLLRACLATSRCRVAYINESETLPFLRGLGIGTDRVLYAPNRMPAPGPVKPAIARHPGERLRVALLGTESPKKNYGQLFDSIDAAGLHSSMHFQAFGHRCAYYEELLRHHPRIQATLFESDHFGLEEFFQHADVLVSVADQEGFGRPIAAAMSQGIPCLLLSKPVFREFFAGADFFNRVSDLVQALGLLADAPPDRRESYVVPPRVAAAYAEAAQALKRAACVRSPVAA